jgi:pSer/pThr/pTyr-binding forkhead associated (FHA) protein
MAIRLTIVDPYEKDAEHERGFVQDRVVLGRARYCDVCLPDMAVSTRHAEIRLEANDYKAVDLGSMNGTLVGGRRLVPHRPRALHNGDVLEIAGFRITFRLGVSTGPLGGRDEAVLQAREMIAALLAGRAAGSGSPAIVVLRGPGRASRYELVEAPCSVRVGRAKGMDIWIEDRDVSREHAEVSWDGETVTVRDLGSHNGLVVRGERVAEAVLGPGDQFVVGNTTLALEHPADGVLAAIQEAPEEETSSFSQPPPSRPPEGNPGIAEADAQASPAEDRPETVAGPSAPLPVGPEDPLSYPGQPGYARTTRELPRPAAEERSDLGLIVVGAIIVVAAVAGLVYLFS